MSHYAVAVVVRASDASEAETAVEDALEPFSEHRDVDPYEEDVTERDVELALSFADKQRERAGEDPVDPEDSAVVLDVVSEWIGREVQRRRDGSLFFETTWNPRGHWDWWVIGGRFSSQFGGCFRLRDGSYADLARVGDIDLAGMRQQAEQGAHAAFDEHERAVAGVPVGPRWAEVLERYGTDRIDEARRVYAADPWVKAARGGAFFEDPHDFWCARAEDPRAEFVARRVAEVAVPYVWLQDGNWEKAGYIGMFMGASPTDYDQDAAWNQHIAERWAALDEDLWVVNVDCHT